MMTAFGDKSINTAYAQGLAEKVLAILIKCCTQMKEDAAKGELLPNNDENKITNRLFHFHLEEEHIHELFYFELQPPENYNPRTGRYDGIGDIRVKQWSMLPNPKAYFIIECKRLDGNSPLNREYIQKGVERFIGDSPKYKSHYGRSIMLGYMVSSIDIPENVIKIDALQAKLVKGAPVGSLALQNNCNSDWYIYSSNYNHIEGKPIILDHLFFDLSAVCC